MKKILTPDIFNDIQGKVAGILVDALGVDEDELKAMASLVDDLGMEDIDVLDIIFRTEKVFDVKITPDDFHMLDFDGQIFSDRKSGRPIRFVRDWMDLVLSTQISSGDLEIKTSMLRFSLSSEGRIIASMSLEDGSWGFADGTHLLPSHLIFLDKGSWAEILKELEDLINSPKVQEADLQKFFEKHKELLQGTEYDMVIPQAVITPEDHDTEWRLDFIARPIDQDNFAKIIEFKRPQISLTKKTNFEQNPFASQLYESLQQLRRYARAFQSPNVQENFHERYKINVYRPDLHLIAGRSWDIELSDRFRDFIKDEQIYVENWDSALERLKRKFT